MAGDKMIWASQENLYKKAVRKMNDEPLIVKDSFKVENDLYAAELFEECGDYLDAPQLAILCRERAEQAREAGKAHVYERSVAELGKKDLPKGLWPKVRDAFDELGDYKDAKELKKLAQKKVDFYERKAKRSRVVVLGALAAVIVATGAGIATGFFRYVEAYGFMKAGMYQEAIENFERKSGFLKADEYLAQAKELQLVYSKVGDKISYGAYDWKVIGKKGKERTLILADIDEDSAFYAVAFNQEEGETNWADSSLRKWLNTEVYEHSFNEREKSHIVMQTTPASANEKAGTAYTEETQDYLTLLTAQQAEKAEEQLASLKEDYWLATPGSSLDRVAYISGGRHQVMMDGYNADSQLLAVRPVIKVDCTDLAD